MLKKIILLTLFIISLSVSSQNTERREKLSAKIIDVNTRFPLRSANIFNLNSVIGKITNHFGEFSINVAKGDVIHISYLGYESVKLTVTNDMLKNKKLEIAINEFLSKRSFRRCLINDDRRPRAVSSYFSQHHKSRTAIRPLNGKPRNDLGFAP